MFAIEKNPSAVKILQIRNEDEWNGQVTVIHTDMRDWKPEEKLDIIISELLLSFGPNRTRTISLGKIKNSLVEKRCVTWRDQRVNKLIHNPR